MKTTQVIEKTSKAIKAWHSAFFFCILLSVFVALVRVFDGRAMGWAPMILFLAGLTGYATTRLAAWWHHG